MSSNTVTTINSVPRGPSGLLSRLNGNQHLDAPSAEKATKPSPAAVAAEAAAAVVAAQRNARNNSNPQPNRNRSRSPQPNRTPFRGHQQPLWPEQIPADIVMEELCPKGLSCLHKKDPALCALNHLVTADGGKYIAGTRVRSVHLCESDKKWALGLEENRCNNLHCLEPHAAGHVGIIKERVAHIDARSIASAAAPPRVPQKREAASAAASEAASATAAASDDDIRLLELDVELIKAEMEMHEDNEAETRKLATSLKVAELKLARVKLLQQRNAGRS